MLLRVREWPHRTYGLLARWMGEMGRAQAQTNTAIESIRGQLEQIADTVKSPLHAQTQTLAAENREYRTRLWNTGAKATQLEQTLSATEERLYFALAERGRLEAEVRQGRLREDIVAGRLAASHDEVTALRAGRETAREEMAAMRRAAQSTQAAVKRAAEELLRLRVETAELRKAISQASALVFEGPSVALEQENARLERELWLLETESKLELDNLRDQLEQAASIAAKEGRAELDAQVRQVETACIRLTSENTTLSVVLKEKEDALARAEEQIKRMTAAQDSLQQERRQYARELDEGAQAKDRVRHLELALSIAEQQIAGLREQLDQGAQSALTPIEAAGLSGPENRIMPWPKPHSWNHPPEAEPFGVRLGEAGELEALAG